MKKNHQTTEEIEQMLEFMHGIGLESLQADGEVLGMIHAVTAGNELILAPLLYRSNEEKQFIYAQLKVMFKTKGVIAFYLITEAWRAGAKVDDEDSSATLKRYQGSLENHPDRQEIMITQYVSYDEVRMNSYQMFRDADGKFSHLGEPERYSSKDAGESAMTVGGALVDLLPKPDEFIFTKSHIH